MRELTTAVLVGALAVDLLITTQLAGRAPCCCRSCRRDMGTRLRRRWCSRRLAGRRACRFAGRPDYGNRCRAWSGHRSVFTLRPRSCLAAADRGSKRHQYRDLSTRPIFARFVEANAFDKLAEVTSHRASTSGNAYLPPCSEPLCESSYRKPSALAPCSVPIS